MTSKCRDQGNPRKSQAHNHNEQKQSAYIMTWTMTDSAIYEKLICCQQVQKSFKHLSEIPKAMICNAWPEHRMLLFQVMIKICAWWTMPLGSIGEIVLINFYGYKIRMGTIPDWLNANFAWQCYPEAVTQVCPTIQNIFSQLDQFQANCPSKQSWLIGKCHTL